MEIRDYLAILKKYWILVLVCALIGLGSGVAAGFLLPKKYESKTQVYVSFSQSGEDALNLAQGANYTGQVVDSYVSIATSSSVLSPVIRSLDLQESPSDLAKDITADSPTGTTLIDIAVVADDPEKAIQIATLVRQNLVRVVQEDLEPSKNKKEDSPMKLTTTEPATKNYDPISPNVTLLALGGLVVGFFLGTIIAFLRALSDNRLHTSDEIQKFSGTTVIGKLLETENQKTKGLINKLPTNSPVVESYRVLRVNLDFLNVGTDKSPIVITSAESGDGKTTTALNLGLTSSQSGANVIVIEADLRRPTFADRLGIEGSVGLTDVLVGRAELDDVIQQWGGGKFHVLPAGQLPPNPSELLATKDMANIVQDLLERFDVVIIDIPPVLRVADAAILGRINSTMILVATVGRITRPQLSAALNSLENAGVRVKGIVANRVKPGRNTGGTNVASYGNYGGNYALVGELLQDEDKAPEPKGTEESRAAKGPRD